MPIKTLLSIGIAVLIVVLVLLSFAIYRYVSSRNNLKRSDKSLESGSYEACEEDEELIRFSGAEDLTVHDILDAPGEVVGKSGCGTLYRAAMQRTGGMSLLRFVRPASAGRTKEILPTVRALGAVRHQNLVPLRALYVGPRGEKLFVHPFYPRGNLSHYLHDGNWEAHSWEFIYNVSLGIAKGLDHLHTGLQKPIVHGNLKANNVLLDNHYQCRLSDFGLHLLLNPATAQEMLEASAAQGYKAPEVIKMKEASMESDVYGLGIIFLEILTRKEPTNNTFLHSRDLHLQTSLRNLVLEHKIANLCKSQNSASEERLLKYFQLAMACCSPSPALRPDSKQVVRKLEEIGR